MSFQPGEKFDYSNTNLVLLGVIIEKLTGMSAAQAFKERIFDPLGLENTLLPLADDSSIPDTHPQGYQFGTNAATIDSYAVPPDQVEAALDGTLPPENETNANPSWAWTAGGAISTAEDLADYAEAMVGGGLLDEEMQTIRVDSIQPTNPANSAGPGYGLGLARFGADVMGHDGQLPGFMSFMGYDPETETTIIVWTNLSAVPSTGEGSALVLAKAIMATLYGASAVPGGSPAQPPGGGTPVTNG